jgi:ribonuclease E
VAAPVAAPVVPTELPKAVEPVVEAAPIVVESAPAAVPAAPAPAPEPVAADPVDLTESLEQAGLVMIETAAGKAMPAAVVSEPAKPLGRKPKPAQVIAQEPLQMVETKRD